MPHILPQLLEHVTIAILAQNKHVLVSVKFLEQIQFSLAFHFQYLCGRGELGIVWYGLFVRAYFIEAVLDELANVAGLRE